MTKLHDFTLEELMIFCVSVLAGVSACATIILKTCFRSKCKTVDLCCIKCVRDVDAVIQEEKLELGKTISNDNKVQEPEPEDMRP